METAKKVSIKDSVVQGSMTDPRDSKVYKTITFMGQTWMAENMKYYDDSLDGKAVCYNDDPTNCDKYGYLYSQTISEKTACPEGWELPSKTDWSDLKWHIIDLLGESTPTAVVLKSKDNWDGLDLIGFNVLPAGYYNSSQGQYYGLNLSATYWTSSMYRDDKYNTAITDYNWNVNFEDDYGNTDFDYGHFGRNYYPVRCIKEEDE